MAFFKKALKKADSTLTSAVSTTASVTTSAIKTTATTVADTAIGTQKVITNNIVPTASSAIHDPSRSKVGRNNHDRDNWVTDYQIPVYFRLSRGRLKFRFATSEGKVLIYDYWRPNQDALINLFEATSGQYLKQVKNSHYKYIKYKEHTIKYHNYAEIINFVKGFISDNYPRSSYASVSKRRFAIRLAEFCAVSIDEIDGKYGLGIKAASQYYTVGDTLVDVGTGVGQIFDGKPVTGSINLIGSAAQNTTKFGIATAKTVVNTNVIKTVVSIPQQFGSVQDNDEKYILSEQHQMSDNSGSGAKVDDGYKVKPGNIEGDSCPICYANGKSHALQCGHILCWDCVQQVDKCPFCKAKKTRVVKLFNITDD